MTQNRAGVDEVHAGAVFGPVFAAAVIVFPCVRGKLIKEKVRDSKKVLQEAERRYLSDIIRSLTVWSIGSASVEETRRQGWLGATHIAMQRAVQGLIIVPDHVDVDGRHFIRHYPKNKQTPVIKGDSTILAISAASIIAKVHADDKIVAMAQKYPWYDLERNKGYLSESHREGIRQHGLCLEHRTFKGAEKLVIATQHEQKELSIA